MITSRHLITELLIRDGCVVVPDAIRVSELTPCLSKARLDALEVPIDPNGGLPWAYDVWAEDYEPLTKNAVEVMERFGAKAKVTRVTLIKKAAGEGRRYWHNDASPSMPLPDHQTEPKDVLLLYYLSPTFTGNGCLVVRPGFVTGPSHDDHNIEPTFDQREVPVELGDVVLMDPRTQHASLANTTNTDRLLIRVWTENVW